MKKAIALIAVAALAMTLAACGGEKQEFGFGEQRLRAGKMFDHVADGLGQRGAAGFAGHDDGMARAGEVVGEKFQLGAFARALGPLKGDEKTGCAHTRCNS